jgi:ribosomal protein L7Ae-like RNA K-turn-binding protein
MLNPWLQHLHFVMKANAYLTGELALRALSQRKVHYAIIATDTSVNHQKQLVERLAFYKIPYVVTLTKEVMSVLTKKKQVVMIAITNANLAKTLKQKESLHEKTSESQTREHPGEPRKN